MQTDSRLRDLVYFDFSKTASILSQAEMGLLKEISSTLEESKDERNIRKYGLAGVFTPEFGSIELEKQTSFQSRTLHHDLLVRVENLLFDQGFAVDINKAVGNTLVNSSCLAREIREKIEGFPYVRAEGKAVFEDYERMKRISNNFNEILEFIRESQRQAFKQTTYYQEARAIIANRRVQANQTSDRKQKQAILNQIKQLEQELENRVETLISSALSENIPNWLIEAVSSFIDTFMPKRLNIRIYPFEDFPSFQVVANLKRECFIDNDLENILLAYGTQTNVKLTVIGIITSFPTEVGDFFNPMQEFIEDSEIQLTDEKTFEKAFRGIFTGFQGLEKFMRFVNYPSVAVYPLAVYRTVHGISAAQEKLSSTSSVRKTLKSKGNSK